MFHVQDILSHSLGSTSMIRSLGDTNVFSCLLYHITVSWKDLGLQYHHRYGWCQLGLHKEAVDWMMFHVLDIVSHRSGPISMTQSLGNTDVFLCLLYHVTVSWKDLGLVELRLICNSRMRGPILPLHDICTTLGDKLTRCLPKLHALSGCDTTSNISTKLSALNKSCSQYFISDPQP